MESLNNDVLSVIGNYVRTCEKCEICYLTPDTFTVKFLMVTIPNICKDCLLHFKKEYPGVYCKVNVQRTPKWSEGNMYPCCDGSLGIKGVIPTSL